MLEHEMWIEIRKLETELAAIDKELEKLNRKLVQLTTLRAKKGRDLKILRSNFGEYADDAQIDLVRALREATH